jgi:hypothetical protein
MQTPSELPQTLDAPLDALAELAVEWWRLDRWANGPRAEASDAPARHVARRLGKFLDDRGLSVLDLTGRPHEPGLAVEVVDVVADAALAPGAEVIDETLAPVVLWRGRVVRHGQVVVRSGAAGAGPGA